MTNANHSITVNLFDHAKHTYGFTTYHIKWGVLVEQLTRGHDVREEKDGTMFNGAMFDDVEGKGVSHRTEANVVGYSIIILDYDGPMTIEQAKQRFSSIEYVGYTSYSHHHPDKNYVDCFRIVVPLKNRVEKEQLTNRKNGLIEWAGGYFYDEQRQANRPVVDRSTFSHSRSFYTPSVSASQVKYAQSWHNEGVLFDIETIPLDPVKVYERNENDLVLPSDDQKRQMMEMLKKISGRTYEEWLSVALAMCSNDFSYFDFLYATNERDSAEAAKMWQATAVKVRRGDVRGMGLLVNHCKKYNVWLTRSERKNEGLRKLLSAVREQHK